MAVPKTTYPFSSPPDPIFRSELIKAIKKFPKKEQLNMLLLLKEWCYYSRNTVDALDQVIYLVEEAVKPLKRQKPKKRKV